MTNRTVGRLALCLLLVWAFACVTMAQDDKAKAEEAAKTCDAPSNFSVWINCRVREVAATRLQQRDPVKRVQLPSIADTTTTLVDHSEAPDALGIALNLAGLSTASGEDDKGGVAFTTTAYALYAALKQRDPLNPTLYAAHPNLRRFSFTFGQETPEGEDAASGKTTLLGTRVLIINKRDSSLRSNRARLAPLSRRLSTATRDFSNIVSDVQDYLFDQLATRVGLPAERNAANLEAFGEQHLSGGHMAATLSMLSEDQLAEITQIISNRIESRVNLDADNMRVIEEIRRAPQLAFTFQSKLREGGGMDEYRTGLTFDYGLARRINLALNATFDYGDSKTVGADTRGGRVAGETHFQLTPDRRVLEGAGPWLFSVSGEGKWMSNAKPAYTGQLKLTIPVLDGVDFPVSVTFANRSDLIKESKVRGRFGFSLDVPRLLKAFKR